MQKLNSLVIFVPNSTKFCTFRYSWSKFCPFLRNFTRGCSKKLKFWSEIGCKVELPKNFIRPISTTGFSPLFFLGSPEGVLARAVVQAAKVETKAHRTSKTGHYLNRLTKTVAEIVWFQFELRGARRARGSRTRGNRRRPPRRKATPSPPKPINQATRTQQQWTRGQRQEEKGYPENNSRFIKCRFWLGSFVHNHEQSN